MRDKFSELIKQGVAKFEYTPTIGSIPEQDPACRAYNNIFSIPSDTHMSCLPDGNRVITGHMINTPKWDAFVCSPFWGAVDFRTTGYWCLCDFLYKFGLEGSVGNLNGDIVYFVKERQTTPSKATPNTVTTTESKIPHNITEITTNGDINKVKECFNSDDVIKSLNESLYIKGDNWAPMGDSIIGLVGNKVVII